jgi:uncharacterized repeat protein (TIGR01451 family)
MKRVLGRRVAALAALAVAAAVIAAAGLDSARAIPEVEPNNSFAAAQPIDPSVPGVFVEGVISPPTLTFFDIDRFSFAGEPGQRIWALVDTGEGVGTSEDSFLELHVDGTFVVADNDSGTGTAGDEPDNEVSSLLAGAVVGEDNVHQLSVSELGFGDSIDPYTLYAVLTDSVPIVEVEPNNNSLQPQPLVGGSGETGLVVGSLEDPPPAGRGLVRLVDFFVVEAEAGDRIFVALSNFSALDIQVSLIFNNGTVSFADATGPGGNEGFAFDTSGITGFDGPLHVAIGANPAPGSRGNGFDYNLMVSNLGASPEINVTKSGSPDTVVAGESVTWTIEVENEGFAAATNVQLLDAQPAGQTFTSLSAPAGWSCTPSPFSAGSDVDCSKASMAPGETATFTITADIAPDFDVDAQACNEAALTFTEGSTAPAEACVEVDAEADLSLTKEGPAEALAGEEFDYTIVLTNNGPSAMSQYQIADLLPEGTAVGTPTFDPPVTSAECVPEGDLVLGCDLVLMLQPGESLTMTIPATLAPDTEAGSEVVNFALVSTSFSEDPVPDPNEDNNADAVTTTVLREADLEVTKELEIPEEDAFLLGDDVTHFLVTVTNNGPSSADNVVLTDVLPPGFDDWDLDIDDPDYVCEEDDGTIVCERTSAMPPGESELMVIHLDFTWGTPNGDLTNTVSVESVNTAPEGEESNATPDPDLTNNSASASARYITPLIFSLGPTTTTTIPAFEENPALTVADEDIVIFDGFEFSILWDGSDVGVTAPLDAFSFLQPDFFIPFGARGEVSELLPPVLISFSQNMTIPAASTVGGTKLVVADHDIVIFHPEQLGSTTEGLFEMFFDASDILLTTATEDIDAIEVDIEPLPCEGRGCGDRIDLYISTAGAFSVLGGLTGQDEDVLVCQDLQEGLQSSCDGFEKAVDGSQIGLGADSEDVNGLSLLFSQFLSGGGSAARLCADRGCPVAFADVLITTSGNFSVNQPEGVFPQILNGANEDVLVCVATFFEVADTECNEFAIYFDGSDFGLATKQLTNIEWDFRLFVDVLCDFGGQGLYSREGERGFCPF